MLNKFLSVKNFYFFSEKYENHVFFIAISTLLIAFVWGLFFAPTDYQQGDNFRIIYAHVPSAFLAQSIYIFLALFGAIYLIWRVKIVAIFLSSSILIGFYMTLIALVTGSIWGKPTWGTYWVWDARLTSMLILLFLYIGLLILQNSISNTENSFKATSMLAIIGAINIPIIKYSVVWWNSLHQGATITVSNSSISMSMFLPLIIAIVAFYLLYFALTMRIIKLTILKIYINESWVQKILGDKL